MTIPLWLYWTFVGLLTFNMVMSPFNRAPSTGAKVVSLAITGALLIALLAGARS